MGLETKSNSGATPDPPDAGWAAAWRAADLAARAHRADRRRGDPDAPYMNHVIEVAALLAEATNGGDPLLVTAALLHDLPARTDMTREALEQSFGGAVADIIFEAHMDRDVAREARRQHEIDTAPRMSARARLLKLADKTSSVRTLYSKPPPEWGRAEIAHYLEWAEAVAEGCAGVNAALDRIFRQTAAECRAHLAEMT